MYLTSKCKNKTYLCVRGTHASERSEHCIREGVSFILSVLGAKTNGPAQRLNIHVDRLNLSNAVSPIGGETSSRANNAQENNQSSQGREPMGEMPTEPDSPKETSQSKLKTGHKISLSLGRKGAFIQSSASASNLHKITKQKPNGQGQKAAAGHEEMAPLIVSGARPPLPHEHKKHSTPNTGGPSARHQDHFFQNEKELHLVSSTTAPSNMQSILIPATQREEHFKNHLKLQVSFKSNAPSDSALENNKAENELPSNRNSSDLKKESHDYLSVLFTSRPSKIPLNDIEKHSETEPKSRENSIDLGLARSKAEDPKKMVSKWLLNSPKSPGRNHYSYNDLSNPHPKLSTDPKIHAKNNKDTRSSLDFQRLRNSEKVQMENGSFTKNAEKEKQFLTPADLGHQNKEFLFKKEESLKFKTSYTQDGILLSSEKPLESSNSMNKPPLFYNPHQSAFWTHASEKEPKNGLGSNTGSNFATFAPELPRPFPFNSSPSK